MRSEPAVPAIAAVDPGGHRPRFSVMLPTYEPGEMLRRSLESVLAQAPPADQMQIAVVDDGSRRHDIARLVRAVDPAGRVELHMEGPRLGISGNCNRAIRLSRGHLVHLLHQDDLVLPGFYARMEHAFLRAPLIGMAFCRSRIVDADGTHLKTNSRQRWWPGILSNWLPRIALRQRVQTPSVVVARSTYEWLGGYRTDLCHALDWEMWVRIAARFPVWYETRPLAAYRRHADNETARLHASGAAWPDLARAIRINAESLPAEIRGPTLSASVRWYVASAMRTAERQIGHGQFARASITLGHVPAILSLLEDQPRSLGLARRLLALKSQLGREQRRGAA